MYPPFRSQKINFTYRDRSCHKMLRYTQTPIQEIQDVAFDKAGVRVLIKREDLNHPFVSGNKWWKLKYNLEDTVKLGHTTLLTFGGAYSNHIYATAAAAKELGLKSIGIIRGEETLPLNQTLSFAVDQGMQLQYVSRELYRTKTEHGFIDPLHEKFGNFYLIPEGGTNELAVKGVTEFAKSLGDDFDYLCCAVGTGGTLAGLIQGVPIGKEILGVSVLKGGDFLKEEVKKLLDSGTHDNWEIATDYHFGGYGKTSSTLLNFIKQFESTQSILLEHVYTGKLFYGVVDRITRNYFKRGSTLLVLHSGGLQGRPIIL
jgi:1-aminocyclopropane-1-carboxylate deaminase